MVFDVITSATDYVRRIVEGCSGLKALLTDDETLSMIGLVYSQLEAYNKGVFLIEKLETPRSEQMKHMKCLVFVRPNSTNLNILQKELASPKFGEYHIFFSNIVRKALLEELAESDTFELVSEVQEYFLDFYAVAPQLFHLNVLPCLLSPSGENPILERLVDGISSLFLALKMRPFIRYDTHSKLCRFVCERLSVRMDQENTLFDFRRRESNPIVLILDRMQDPLTPLMTPWTYEAMIHELIGVKNNRVNLRHSPDARKGYQEVVLDSKQDKFYNVNRYKNYGDLGVNIKSLVDQFQEKARYNHSTSTIEDMMKFLEAYPELRSSSSEVNKHVILISELSRLVTSRHLMDVAQLEQDIACRNSLTEHQNQLFKILESPSIHIEDKFRLSLIYALRYEEIPQNRLGEIKDTLKKLGLSAERLQLFSSLLKYGGNASRTSDIFQNKSILGLVRNTVRRGIVGVENVFAQHVPLIVHIIDDIMKGRLRETEFPFMTPATGKNVPKEILIFITGGVTYQESRVVAIINGELQTESEPEISAVANFAQSNGFRIILGGSTIHNSKSFLSEVSRIAYPWR
ncbi:hypothetical protein GpartN1_g4941.t1 [Galdieria partita]|uniref:Vacuolar protein sorting-associated protein 45 n=1 Tax=Galdieria partita TaxID=83374 RepID=A0A9C7URW9_9RHOD|nr:hypothetical protein GpartN1_g4941.t1 [Galdieria partita]